MDETRHVEKTYQIVHLGEKKSDFAYWQAQPFEVRLSTMEQIRQEYHRWKYGAEPRLQRVFTIIKR